MNIHSLSEQRLVARQRDLDNSRILVVDDQSTVRRILRKGLENLSYAVTDATSGDEALALLAENSFDLVLLDILMPNMSGLEVLKAIRETHSAHDLPVIMVTIKQESTTIVEALESGANDYIVKPIDFPVLSTRVKTHLMRKRAEEAVQEMQGSLEQIIAERTQQIVTANETLVREVADRKEAEESLRASEQRLMLAQKVAGVATWEWDIKRNTNQMSPEHAALYGYGSSARAISFDEWLKLVYPDDRPKVTAAIDRSLTDPAREYRCDFRVISEDGQIWWMGAVGKVIVDGNGEPTRMIGVDIDITARKHFEDRVEGKEAQLRLMADSLPVIINYIDKDHRYRFNNEAYREWFGIDPEDAFGEKVVDVIGKEAYTIFGPLIDRALAGEQVDVELTTPGEKTTRRSARYQANPHTNDEGEVLGICSIITDMTERKQVEYELRQSEKHFRLLVESLHDALVQIDANNNVAYVNSSLCEMFGYTQQELIGRPYTDFVDNRSQMEVRNQLARHRTGETQPYEIAVTHKNGHRVQILMTPQPLFDESGAYLGSFGIATEITDLKRMEYTLLESEERYRALHDSIPLLIFSVDDVGKILSANAHAAGYLGYSITELIGTGIERILNSSDRKRAITHIEQTFFYPEGSRWLEVIAVHKDGTEFLIRVTTQLVNTQGKPSVLFLAEDITETRQLTDQITYQASHDLLTGLANRSELEHRIEVSLPLLRTDKTQHTLISMDLDQFKVVNETCGHVAGDELLRQVAELLQASTRNRDFLARTGGDDFAVFLERCSLEQAERTLKTIETAFAKFKFVWEGNHFDVNASIGVIPVANPDESVLSIISNADAACYAAKEAGRNRVFVATDDDLDRRHGEMRWVTRINEALQEDRFELFFQTIVPVAKQEQLGQIFEILIRLRDDDGSLIPPGAFLPAAERYDLSGKLDRWVIKTLLTWLAQNPRAAQQIHHCSVNLSAQSLSDDNLLAYIEGALNEHAIAPQLICFEVTETATITRLSQAISFINALKSKGCLFAIDDFGSGMSSFAYLKNLPVDYLKIDGVFVKNIADDPIDLAMVKSINEIGQVLGKKTIAEFVESEAILLRLEELGVDYAQGYGISKPRPLHEFLDSLKPE